MIAVDSQRGSDRDAVLLRFYEQRPLAEVGRLLGISEDAARMRVQRAVEKLRAMLQKQGVTGSSAGLSAALVGNVAQEVPARVIEGVMSAVGGGGNVVARGIAKGAMRMMAMAKVGVAAGIAVLLALLAAGAVALATGLPLSTAPAASATSALTPESGAAGVDADMTPVRAAIEARLARLTNLLSTYEVTTRYAQQEQTPPAVNGRGSIVLGGTRVEQKTLEVLGELSGYESVLVPEKSQRQSAVALRMQQHSIAKYGKDRTEQLQLSRDGKPRGRISDPLPLPDADLEVALGSRGIRSQSRLDAASLRDMKLERIDAQHVRLVAENGRVQDEWMLDSAAGYAPVSYKRIVDHTNADFELTVDKMINQNRLTLPQSATLVQRSWFAGKPTTIMTTTIVVTEYRLGDPQNTADRYEMKWPVGAEVHDTRSGPAKPEGERGSKAQP